MLIGVLCEVIALARNISRFTRRSFRECIIRVTRGMLLEEPILKFHRRDNDCSNYINETYRYINKV